MIVVLDASGAAEVIAKTVYGADFYNVMMHADKVIAPDLYISETANIAWKHGRKDRDNAKSYIEESNNCIDFIDEFASSLELRIEALRLAQEHDHSVYDMLYAALARRYDAVLVTMDVKLREVCKKISVRVRELYPDL